MIFLDIEWCKWACDNDIISIYTENVGIGYLVDIFFVIGKSTDYWMCYRMHF